jgi:hypothetical protein
VLPLLRHARYVLSGNPVTGLAFALFALFLFWVPSTPTTDIGQRVIRVLAAGFGAMAIFRSSIFITRIGDQDVPVGPGAFLQVILGATDRGVDRLRAEARAEAVQKAMSGVDFDAAHVALPTFCLALMQNLPAEDQAALAKQITELGQSSMTSDLKSLSLGLALMNAVGDGVLTSAVGTLAGEIKAASVITVVGLDKAELAAGKSAQVRAEVKDRSGKLIPGKPVAWTSSDPACATIDALGNVRALKSGTSELAASANGVIGSLTITIN